VIMFSQAHLYADDELVTTQQSLFRPSKISS
jgi:hypothetical protein